jgi:hypothetical protein
LIPAILPMAAWARCLKSEQSTPSPARMPQEKFS